MDWRLGKLIVGSIAPLKGSKLIMTPAEKRLLTLRDKNRRVKRMDINRFLPKDVLKRKKGILRKNYLLDLSTIL
jgi:hypothetical protein